mmetsp:Transcript_14944/g.43111  ORF Transcript_14944/g.43111 Transcript_14944/m.43111 type:complete len:214 (+) Transcript_14944:648-1289(+)
MISKGFSSFGMATRRTVPAATFKDLRFRMVPSPSVTWPSATRFPHTDLDSSGTNEATTASIRLLLSSVGTTNSVLDSSSSFSKSSSARISSSSSSLCLIRPAFSSWFSNASSSFRSNWSLGGGLANSSIFWQILLTFRLETDGTENAEIFSSCKNTTRYISMIDIPGISSILTISYVGCRLQFPDDSADCSNCSNCSETTICSTSASGISENG